jgi:acetyltransferase-like isoleucine patch superfamily enzyme
MGLITNYIRSFCTKTRYFQGISLFSFWDEQSKFSSKVYLAQGVNLGNTSLGDYTRIRQLSTLHHVDVGKYCSISRNVRIGLGRHPLNLISTNSIFYSQNKTAIRTDWINKINFEEHKPTKIGHDVWIGEFVTVIGGVNIGDGAVIATKSVVTKDVPPYAIVGGIPAKVLKYRFDEETIAALLQIRWWDLPDDEITKKIEAFTKTNLNKDLLNEYFLDK